MKDEIDVSQMVKLHSEYGLALPNDEDSTLTLRKEFANLQPATTPEGYDEHRVALGKLVRIRTSIEKRRVELKAESLAYGRKIDAFAKHWTGFIESIETPIRQAKAIIDAAAEKARKEAAEAEAARLAEIERQRIAAEQAKLRLEREAEEARLKAVRDAEAMQLAKEREALMVERERQAEEVRIAKEQQRAERERVAAERKVIEDRQREEQARINGARQAQELAMRQEREKIDAERAAIERERQRQERDEFQRQAKAKAEQEARDRIERERQEAEAKAREQAERERLEQERIAALRPDAEKVQAFAARIRELQGPLVKSADAMAQVKLATTSLGKIVANLEKWTLQNGVVPQELQEAI